MRHLALIATALAALSVAPRPAPAVERPLLELKDGDRVVLLGGTLIDREQYYGYIEAGLVSRFPGRKIAFRNIGWDGDTVFEQHRPENFGSIMQHLERLKPTVLIVCYGSMESERGAAGAPPFAAKYGELLAKFAKTGAWIVLISPFPREPGADGARASSYNVSLAGYVSQIKELARRPNRTFVDLSRGLAHQTDYPPLCFTDNGVHLNALGYWRATHEVLGGLGLPRPGWRRVEIAGTTVNAASGTNVSRVTRSDRSLQFEVLDTHLPLPPAPPAHRNVPLPAAGQRVLQITGLEPGHYQLSIDGKPIAAAEHDAWRSYGVNSGPELEQAEQLRQAIVEKNELFYYRFRPHNGEYVYGRRSKSFSSNSGNEQFPAEMAKLDEMIAAADARIAKLSVPVAHRYELVRVKEAN